MKRIWRRKAGAAASLALAVLTACSFGSETEETSAEPAVIKAMYWDESAFYQHFGNLFLLQHPNVELEVVSTQSIYQQGQDPIKGLKELVAKEQPDVLLLNDYNFGSFREDGLLYELDALVAQDEEWLEGILPAAIDHLRSLGDGKLYGLAPSFSSQALFYNKKLFEQHGVPLPTDGMTWDELVALAERFPTDGGDSERVYGLDAFRGNASIWNMFQFGSAEGLIYLDPDSKKITLHTDSWKQVAERVKRIATSEAVFKQDSENPDFGGSYEEFLRRDLFLTGRIAMRPDYAYYVNQLKEAAQRLEEAKELDWDVVTVPAAPNAPNGSTSFQLQDIFAINAQSTNVEAAWEFVKFIHSDDFARVTARAPVFGGLPTRVEYIRNDEGKNLEAFYASASSSSASSGPDFSRLPESFNANFFGIADKHWQAFLQDELTAEEMLSQIETEAQAMLDQAVEQEAAGEPGSGDAADEAPQEAAQEAVQE
ncbi:ABC transporter substrate-binding protein [Paenibacillus sp.]|uniref:ABC transporter substrate-binding protein n=1 Tax=Paenibacillus sp. TaxID=58172 RepID=UPI002D67AEC5|nr:extracellular solute-binding protein [Paenibacillus sp.]HZG87638.1 extracellular solute-binding protein [Paenibacillus sp.]